VGLVVNDETDEPVAGVKVYGIYRNMIAGRDIKASTDDRGEFQITRELHRTVLFTRTEDRSMKGIVEISEDQESATIRLRPVAQAVGRLDDRDTKEPLAGEEIRYGIRVYLGDEDAPTRTAFGGSVETDSEGRFTLKNLILGQECRISVARNDGRSYSGVGSVTPIRAETIALGDLKHSPPSKPPTFEERMEKNLVAEGTPLERYEKALEEAKGLHQLVMVVFLKRGEALTDSWFKLKLDDSKVGVALADYQLIQVAASAEGAGELAEKLGVELDEASLPMWQFSDASGEELLVETVTQLDGAIDRAELLVTLASHAPEPLDAREILQESLAEAEKSNRLVIVVETTTRSESSRKLNRFFESQRKILEKDYLWIEIDQRWLNSKEVMDEINPDRRRSVPWFAIIDHNKGVMATSDGARGNVGFPQGEDNVEHFLLMLELTMLRMTEEDVEVLREVLIAE
jgi:hypothetical protein